MLAEAHQAWASVRTGVEWDWEGGETAPRRAIQLKPNYPRARGRERVLEWLEKAYEARDPNVVYMGVIPLFDSVRDDPRLQDLRRRMNLPQ